MLQRAAPTAVVMGARRRYPLGRRFKHVEKDGMGIATMLFCNLYAHKIAHNRTGDKDRLSAAQARNPVARISQGAYLNILMFVHTHPAIINPPAPMPPEQSVCHL
jgi:hypothetical protein